MNKTLNLIYLIVEILVLLPLHILLLFPAIYLHYIPTIKEHKRHSKYRFYGNKRSVKLVNLQSFYTVASTIHWKKYKNDMFKNSIFGGRIFNNMYHAGIIIMNNHGYVLTPLCYFLSKIIISRIYKSTNIYM